MIRRPSPGKPHLPRFYMYIVHFFSSVNRLSRQGFTTAARAAIKQLFH